LSVPLGSLLLQETINRVEITSRKRRIDFIENDGFKRGLKVLKKLKWIAKKRSIL
jgi:hypothetical protein